MNQQNKKQLFLKIISDFLENLTTEEYIRSTLLIGKEKVEKNIQDPIDEARTLYQNINTICLVEKVRLNPKAQKALDDLNALSMRKGLFANLNAWNTINTFGGN